MNKEEVEKYIKTLELKPDCKYIVFVSKESGLAPKDLYKLKTDRPGIIFAITAGNPNDLISIIETPE